MGNSQRRQEQQERWLQEKQSQQQPIFNACKTCGGQNQIYGQACHFCGCRLNSCRYQRTATFSGSRMCNSNTYD